MPACELMTLAFGSTPMTLPLGQLITPAAGAVATGVAGLYVPLLTDVAAAAERRQS